MKKVLEKEFEKEVEEEAEKELFSKRAERESFIIASKKCAFLSRNGEKDISESILWKSLKIDIDFK